MVSMPVSCLIRMVHVQPSPRMSEKSDVSLLLALEKNVSDSELYLFIFSLIDCDFSKQVQCLLGEVCDLLLFKLLLPCFSGAFVVTNVTHKEKKTTARETKRISDKPGLSFM